MTDQELLTERAKATAKAINPMNWLLIAQVLEADLRWAYRRGQAEARGS